VDASVTVNYFRENEGTRCGQYNKPLNNNGIAIVFPSPPGGICGSFETKFVGAARANRNANGISYTSAVVVNQEEFTTGTQKMSYSATGGGTATVVVPWVMNDYGPWQGRNHWWTGLNVQNTSGNTASVTVSYYDPDNGSWLASSQPVTIPPKSLHVFFPTEIGSNHVCSAVVTANQYIAVVANHWSASSSDDTFMSHTGLNR
jgi:hypothetical protein